MSGLGFAQHSNDLDPTYRTLGVLFQLQFNLEKDEVLSRVPRWVRSYGVHLMPLGHFFSPLPFLFKIHFISDINGFLNFTNHRLIGGF